MPSPAWAAKRSVPAKGAVQQARDLALCSCLGCDPGCAPAHDRIERGEIDRMCCHPGGVKVIDAIESALELNQGELNLEREVLRDYGNMSAPTVMFVLERLLERGLPD